MKSIISTLCLALTLAVPCVAQSDATAKPDFDGALTRCLLTADGDARTAMDAAIDAMQKTGKDARARLGATEARFTRTAAEIPPTEADSQPVAIADALLPKLRIAISADAAAADAALAEIKGDAANGPAIKSVARRSRVLLSRAVEKFTVRQMSSNALFAGQYAELRDYGPSVVTLMTRWVKDPPKTVKNPTAYRPCCVRALRDLIEGKPSEVTMKALEGAVGDSSRGDQGLATAAAYALAQFGDRRFVDTQVKGLENVVATTKDESMRLSALNGLADVYYNLRDYKKAVETYRKVTTVLDGDGPKPSDAGTIYYNAACSASLGGMLDDAFIWLDKALKTSATGTGVSMQTVAVDMDIENLRKDPRFKALADQYMKPKPATESRPGGAPQD